MAHVTINFTNHMEIDPQGEIDALAKKFDLTAEIVSTEDFWPDVKFTGAVYNLKFMLIEWLGDVMIAKTILFPKIKLV